MYESSLLHELIHCSAHRAGDAPDRAGDAPALVYGRATLTYSGLAKGVADFSSGLLSLGLARADRVGIYLEKRFETVIASFGAPAAGGVFVPMNPLLKPEQAVFIMKDCDVRVLVTSPERLTLLAPVLAECPSLRHVVTTARLREPRACASR